MTTDPLTPGPLATIELVALRVLTHAVRCREVSGGLLTYRRAKPDVVPGERLTVAPTRRWTFRRTEFVGGPLLHHGYSLVALTRAGLSRPIAIGGGLACPSARDERLRDALEDLASGDWLGARCLLQDVLEDWPGSLLAHAAMGDIAAGLFHRALALAHYTAAIRLGAGALDRRDVLPLDPSRAVEGALLGSLRGRAVILLAQGDTEAAAADLRRALAWDETDAVEAGQLLRELGAPPARTDLGAAGTPAAAAGLTP